MTVLFGKARVRLNVVKGVAQVMKVLFVFFLSFFLSFFFSSLGEGLLGP